jgi:hypothetical protein
LRKRGIAAKTSGATRAIAVDPDGTVIVFAAEPAAGSRQP